MRELQNRTPSLFIYACDFIYRTGRHLFLNGISKVIPILASMDCNNLLQIISQLYHNRYFARKYSRCKIRPINRSFLWILGTNKTLLIYFIIPFEKWMNTLPLPWIWWTSSHRAIIEATITCSKLDNSLNLPWIFNHILSGFRIQHQIHWKKFKK